MAKLPEDYVPRTDPVGIIGQEVFKVFIDHADVVTSEEFMLKVLAEIAGSVISSQVEDDLGRFFPSPESQVEGVLLFERVEAFAKQVKEKAETNLKILRSKRYGT